MKTFAIHTLGCKVNTYESQGYIEGLIAYGYTQVAFKEWADIYIINTCAVTNTAASKSKQKIHQAQKQNKNAFICVIGCLIQTSSEELNVDLIIGSSGKKEVAKRIVEALENNEKIKYIENIAEITQFESMPIHSFANQTRAYLKIQDGCNQFCSYCIIPYARGRERSLSFEEAIATARELVKNSHKEIVLSGIHTGRYGIDLNTNLHTLLKEMVLIEGIERIRISSIEMNELTEEFLHFMKNEKKIAKHLHIPLQSACNRTLQRMNRPYTIEEYIRKIEYIRFLMPSIAISSDMIIGFPDEKEEDFKTTMDNLSKLSFSFIHVFPFSKRNGTKACAIENHLTNREKKNRCQKVSLLSKKHYNEYKSKFIGKDVDVLFEYEKDGFLYGHTSEYIPFKAKLDFENINQLCTMKAMGLKDGILYHE